MAKVSIIIPTYNVEPYLRECMDSVTNQTLKEIEIICVNDGSSDNSLKIINEYAAKDSRIKVIDKPNSGYGDSMNKGLDAATGEYIGIVEPDDYVELDMYKILYNKAHEHDLDFIKADFHAFIGSGKNRKLFYRKLNQSGKYYDKVVDMSKDLTPFYFIMNTWSGIYKRDFIEKYHIRHSTTPGASFQDIGFWFQTLARSQRAYFLACPFYKYRIDNENSSVKNKGKVYAAKYEHDRNREFLEKNPELKKRLLGISYFARYRSYQFTLSRIDHSFKKEFIKNFSIEFKNARKNGELDESLFSPADRQKLNLIVKNPVRYYRKSLNRLSPAEKIFSVKNKGIYKIVHVCGMKIKIKSKHRELAEQVQILKTEIKKLQQDIIKTKAK